MPRHFFLALAIILLSSSCIEDLFDIPEEIIGLAPIYLGQEDLSFSFEAAKPVQNLGQVYQEDGLLLIIDTWRGVHLINNQEPTAPEKLGFLTIGGVTDLSLQGDLLYANRGADLWVIDLSDLQAPQLIEQVSDFFALNDAGIPIGFSGYFACPDPAKGEVVGWYETVLRFPQCLR